MTTNTTLIIEYGNSSRVTCNQKLKTIKILFALWELLITCLLNHIC